MQTFTKTCGHCGSRFTTLGAKTTHCSPRCYLLGRSIPNADGCHIWQGRPGGHGYGEVVIDKVRHLPHRLAYETFVGPVPGGYYVCHRCDTPLCANPDHLFLGTVLENTRDCVVKKRNRRKLTDEEVQYIRSVLVAPVYGDTTRVARELGVSTALVSYVRRGRRWKHLLPGNINFQKAP